MARGIVMELNVLVCVEKEEMVQRADGTIILLYGKYESRHSHAKWRCRVKFVVTVTIECRSGTSG